MPLSPQREGNNAPSSPVSALVRGEKRGFVRLRVGAGEKKDLPFMFMASSPSRSFFHRLRAGSGEKRNCCSRSLFRLRSFFHCLHACLGEKRRGCSRSWRAMPHSRIMRRKRSRSDALRRNMPENLLVTVMTSGLRTPRRLMH